MLDRIVAMSRARPDEVLRVLREFIDRIDRIEPEAPELGELEVGWRGDTERIVIRQSTAQALAEALIAYRDPRDHGTCDHCGGNLDRDLQCRRCGIVNGIFGQTIADFLSRAQQPAPAVTERSALEAPADGSPSIPDRPALEA